ncbi:hypothetical protein BJF78_08190 [Pseudonocardia sp. CNS-139]|nr:hypothetical protein BJF78_08190 [Pseudonocardia sp. CNS-139]
MGSGAHRSPVNTSLRRGAAALAVTGGAFSLVGAASPVLQGSGDVPVTPVAQAAAGDLVLRAAVEPVDPDPDVIDASDLLKAVQIAEDTIARLTAERAAAEERAATETRQRAEPRR